jgi:hypothetical protein
MHILRGCLFLAIVLLLSGWSWGQGSKQLPGGKDDPKKQTGKNGPPEKTKDSGDKSGKPPTFDKLKVPPNTIVIVVDALSNIPKMIMMSPKEYQALLDEIAALKNKLKVEKKLPHSCKLSARVEGNQVSLQAEFAFITENPNMTVVLGLQGANLKDEGELLRGQVERQIPLLDFGPDGYVIQVDKPGPYKLTLNLKLPLGVKRSGSGSGGERNFELGLPGAAVTTLSLDPPAGVKEIRWNDHVETRQEAARLTLGKIKSLNVSWKEPVSLPGTGALLTAESQIVVNLDEKQMLTTAELKLGDLRGQPKNEWRLLLPPGAKVEVKGPMSSQAEIVPAEKNNGTTIIRLKEPSAENLVVLVHAQQPRRGPGAKMPIGPFVLLGAFEQQGKILFKAVPEARRGARLLFHSRGEVGQREIPANSSPDVVALFSYDKLPDPAKGPPKTASAWAPLEIELKPEMGQIETQVDHVLRLSQAPEGWQADLTTKIKGKMISAHVETLEVQLPRPRPESLAILAANQGFPGLPWAALYWASQKNWPLTIPVEFQCHGEGGINPELRPGNSGRARIHLQRPEAKEFTLVLTGKYLLPAGVWRAGLELPLPLGTLDRGGQVKVVVDDNLELLTNQASGEQAPGRQSQIVSFDQAPRRVDFAWRPFRPEFPVSGVTDITIHHDNAHFRHVFQVPAARGSPASKRKGQPALLFRIPPQIKGLKVEPADRLHSYNPEKGIAWIFPADEGGPLSGVVIEYDLALPGAKGRNKSQTFAVPLLWPEKATRIDAKVRVWCDLGLIPSLANPAGPLDSWRDRGTEVVTDKNSLPGLVLHASGLALPLTLRLEEGEANLPAVVFDRGLVQVSIREDGAQYYRTRFQVRKLNADYLDIKFPGPAMNLLLGLSLDKERIDNCSPLETDSTTLRVPVKPGLYGQPVFLDLEYLVPASATESERFWQTQVHPPLVANAVFVAGVRWQFAFPPSVLPIGGMGAGQMDYHWQFNNWLLTPEPATTPEELERWMSGSDGARPLSLVIGRAALEPMRIWHFPRQIWLLICSGLVLAVGLVLGLASSRVFFWFMLLLVIISGVGIGLAWPALLPNVVYGGQPGLVVLIVILAIQWMLQERYRRQVVFMPGFTRLKSNSSLIRSGAARSREPTTVDAPATPSVLTGPGKGK